MMADESEGTVLLAGAANLAIAVAKCIAGLLSGSTALLAEAAHSVADTLNQVFLLTALKRSRKPADALHQFGYGMERYFWSLLAAVGIFVLGAGFSIAEGIRAVLAPEPVAALAVVYSVLVVSFIFEGISWLRAVRQVRREAHDQGISALDHLKEAEPAVKTVAFEDSAALIGLVIAAAGVTLSTVTGEEFWDGAASIAIGLLLIGVAFALGRDNKSMLIGQALPDDVQDEIRHLIAGDPGDRRGRRTPQPAPRPGPGPGGRPGRPRRLRDHRRRGRTTRRADRPRSTPPVPDRPPPLLGPNACDQPRPRPSQSALTAVSQVSPRGGWRL